MSCLDSSRSIHAIDIISVNLTLTREIKLDLVRGFLQQSVEKIDRTRQIALDALHHLVHSEIELVNHELLMKAVPLMQLVECRCFCTQPFSR